MGTIYPGERRINLTLSSLSKLEKEFIDIWGDIYERRGQLRSLGELWALLTLKADSPDIGLDQHQIAHYLHSSPSTISRNLKTLTEMKIVEYSEQRIRKYFTDTNFREISNLRFQATINEYKWTIEELNKIKDSIPSHRNKENENLIETIVFMEKFLQKIIDIYQKIINMN